MEDMCNLGEAVSAMGIEKGIAIGAQAKEPDSTRGLMLALGLTAEQAMDALRVPADMRRKHADML